MDLQLQTISVEQFSADRLPLMRVGGDETDRAGGDWRALDTIPNVIEVVEHQPCVSPFAPLQLEEPVTCSPTWRRALLVVKEIDLDGSVGVELPVERRPVFEARKKEIDRTRVRSRCPEI